MGLGRAWSPPIRIRKERRAGHRTETRERRPEDRGEDKATGYHRPKHKGQGIRACMVRWSDGRRPYDARRRPNRRRHSPHYQLGREEAHAPIQTDHGHRPPPEPGKPSHQNRTQCPPRKHRRPPRPTRDHGQQNEQGKTPTQARNTTR